MLNEKKNIPRVTDSARSWLYKHDEMQMDASWLQLNIPDNIKAVCKKGALASICFFSEALNACRAVKPPPCPAACFGYFEDAWWYCTAEGETVCISLLWGHITDPLESQPLTVLWIRAKVLCKPRRSEVCLAAENEWLVMPKVLNVHIVCLQILGEICVAFPLESNNLQNNVTHGVRVCVSAVSLCFTTQYSQ